MSEKGSQQPKMVSKRRQPDSNQRHAG